MAMTKKELIEALASVLDDAQIYVDLTQSISTVKYGYHPEHPFFACNVAWHDWQLNDLEVRQVLIA